MAAREYNLQVIDIGTLGCPVLRDETITVTKLEDLDDLVEQYRYVNIDDSGQIVIYVSGDSE